ncbi:sigma-70 family RNA polymerase sigma factor [Umezawaea beigongshangensis]|uniref:sigma-70 family RNA polymerase sigma factor n=1 Tax=Umezawaea beigongshangensis TaxID=2780383 RepID=UPI0018F21A80|nr:sigma-70 family RNA polymerase sigma factor [Umezawaea beigongshangensis]
MVADAVAPRRAPDGPPDDLELLARVRAGDDTAFGELFARHSEVVRRFALRHVGAAAEADDLTAETFFRVLQAVRRGSGPRDHFRTYLLTVTRRVAWEWSARRRDVPVDDEELFRRVEPFADTAGRRAEHTLITRAFASLPERWRTVLWRVEVEGERPATVAPHFGLSPNAMAALARRAREGLRAAYLQAHLAEGRGGRSCRSVLTKLGTYTAGGARGSEEQRIRQHLETCSSCRSLHDELVEVCSALRAHAPLIALPAAALAGGHASAVLGELSLLAGRAKLAVVAASTAALGLFGVAALLPDGGPAAVLLQPDQRASGVLELSTPNSSAGRSTTAPGDADAPAEPGTGAPVAVVPGHRDGAGRTTPPAGVTRRDGEPVRTGELVAPVVVSAPSSVARDAGVRDAGVRDAVVRDAVARDTTSPVVPSEEPGGVGVRSEPASSASASSTSASGSPSTSEAAPTSERQGVRSSPSITTTSVRLRPTPLSHPADADAQRAP